MIDMGTLMSSVCVWMPCCSGTAGACIPSMSTLVVYFSRTGTTRSVAETIASSLGADIEAIHEPRSRLGLRGYIHSALDATLSRWVPIDAIRRDPTRYDLVVVGTPVWGWSLSAPVRAFLSNHARRLPRVAFFVTKGGSGDRRVFRQMAEVAAASPVATLALYQRDVERGLVTHAIESFIDSLPRKSDERSLSARQVS
jgi:menaquinone-dependent protoporphyrinogen IX oxidase